MTFPAPRAAAVSAALLLACSILAQKDSATSPIETVRRPSVSSSPGAQIALKYATFDPARALPVIPDSLRARPTNGLFVVQVAAEVPRQADRDAIVGAGGEIHGYLPHNAYVVRMDRTTAQRVAALDATRFVGDYEPAFRLDLELIREHLAGGPIPQRDYNIVVVDKRRDKPALSRAIKALGGTVVDAQDRGLLMTVRLTGAQLIAAAGLDQVLWIDRWDAPEHDMDNGRIQGGANDVEANLGYSGQGVRGHIYEGVEFDHPDFTTPLTNVASGGAADAHGHATAGIVFGNGTSNPAVRGMAPDAIGFYTNYSTDVGSRNSVIDQVVNTHNAMFTTASWGNARTRSYTSISADSDDVVFDHRIPWTQSQSNAGNQDSRPQAWGKNLISVGGVRHRNNANPADDSWSGGGSTGPAADGRIKPDLCAYYDGIGTSDLTTGGYSSANNWTTSFGGTSGATPMVAGHNAIAIQMYTDGVFGNTLPAPGGSRFANRPLAQTLKALMIANAEQYAFTSTSTDNRREHCGWGFPSLRNLYDNRAKMLIIAENDPLTQGASRSYAVTVNPGESALKVCMTFVDPAGNPSSTLARINDLSLRVIAPNGAIYWGNNGLTAGNFSTPGGSANTIDTVENVFVQNPAAGTWTIEVLATLVAQDAHVATASAVDATFALCASGIVGTVSNVTPAQFSNYGNGCGPAASAISLTNTFYEPFGAFDLANSALRFTPAAGGEWSVAPHAPGFESGFSNGLNLGDDQLAVGNALGFVFPLNGGGTTTSIDIDSNGWIGLISGQHGGTDFSESVTEYLVNPARIAVLWDDLNPATGGDVYFDTFPGRAVITWNAVPEYPTVGSNTAQLQLFADGSFALAYGAVSTSDCLVGFSRGNGVADPGAVDISNPTTNPATLAIGSDLTPRVGRTIQLRVDGLPASSVAAVIALGFTQQAIDLSILGMTGCSLLTEFSQQLPAAIAGPTATAGLTIPTNTVLIGNSAYVQGVVIAPGANPFGVLTSNGGVLTVGDV